MFHADGGAGGFGILPALAVIALLRSLRENRHDGGALRGDEQLNGAEADGFDARVDGVGIGDFEPASVGANEVSDHALDLKAVIGAEHAVEQLGAELVEAVAPPIVPGRVGHESAAGLDHLHAVLDGLRKVEDVFECAAVVNDVEALLEIVGQGLVEIVDELRAFEIGEVESVDVFCAEGFEDGFGEAGVGRAGREGFAGEAVGFEQSFEFRGVDVEILTAERDDVTELDAALAGRDQELHCVDVEAHVTSMNWRRAFALR